MKNFNQFNSNNPASDYFNQLKPYTTNPRGQSQQLYKNYRNEGVANYPHMQDYERTMAQQAALKEQEQAIMNQYGVNKNKLIQDEEAKYNAKQAEYKAQQQAEAEQLKQLQLQQQLQAQQQAEQQKIAQQQQEQAKQKALAEQQRIAQQKALAEQQRIAQQKKTALKPRTLYTMAPNIPIEVHNTMTGNGVMSRFVMPFSEFQSNYGLNHPYMKSEAAQNHGKWYDPNNGKYYNTQF